MVSSGEKKYNFFIGYKDDYHNIKPLCIMPSKTSAYVKIYSGKTKWIYFFIEHDKILEKHNGI